MEKLFDGEPTFQDSNNVIVPSAGAPDTAGFGLTLTTNSDGTTTIHGIVVDLSALHGLLQKVRDIGLPLISVTRVEPMPTAPPTSPV